MSDDLLLKEHYKLMHLGWLLGEAKMGELITLDEFRWLIENAGEEFIAKVLENNNQKLRIKNPFEKVLSPNCSDVDADFNRGSYYGFEEFRKVMKI